MNANYPPETFDIYWTALFAGIFSLLRPALDVLVFNPLAKRLVPEGKTALKVASKEATPAEGARRRKDATKESPAAQTLDQDELDDIDPDEFIEGKGKIVKKTVKAAPTSRALTITKFKESGWRLFFYTLAWIGGVWVLSNETDWWSWSDITNTDIYFKGWPNHPISYNLKMYYLISLAFYLYSIATSHSETKKKDHVQMMLHHIVTAALVGGSYLVGVHRVGAVILLVHDSADPLMEFAKLANYSQKRALANTVFALFFLVWVVTRLVYFPFVLVRTVIFDMSRDMGNPAMDGWVLFFALFLSSLQVMHIIWTTHIVRVLRNGIKGDVREDED